MRLLLSLLSVAAASNTNYNRRERDAMRRVRAPDALPQEIFRESVEPQKGGKVPESAHMRIELNKIDAAGLDNAEALRMLAVMEAESMRLPERSDRNLIDAGSGYQPGASPPIKLYPEYNPEPAPIDPEPTFQNLGPATTFHTPAPAYHAPLPAAPTYQPAPAYQPAPVVPTPVAYLPEEPVYQAPVGPVLLEERPYEVKSVQPLPISVAETYTNFDCRTKEYLGRHYADQEAGCEIYHYCHEDGKQDSYHCGYGTLFNEYLGTCDYKNNVHCISGEGYAPPTAPYHAPVPAPAPYHPPAPAPYHAPAPAPYVAPAPAPAPYHPPAPAPAPYHPPAPAPTTFHHAAATGFQQQPFKSFTAFG